VEVMMFPKAIKTAIALSCLLCLGGLLAGCQATTPQVTQEGEAEMAIQITSAAFSEGGMIPKMYTCSGEDLSPPLAWSGVPQEAKSLALIMDDPDAPGKVFVHWVLFNIPASAMELPEGMQGSGIPGVNNFRLTGYNGPCPPSGQTHRYLFKIYALDQELKLTEGASKADVENAMVGHILASGQLMGKFKR
jgi:Raf kinase inhibitor-like YbhB/YbcL family protein